MLETGVGHNPHGMIEPQKGAGPGRGASRTPDVGSFGEGPPPTTRARAREASGASKYLLGMGRKVHQAVWQLHSCEEVPEVLCES